MYENSLMLDFGGLLLNIETYAHDFGLVADD
jgi:hypothetical protein